MLQVNQLSVSYAAPILHEVSLKIVPGEFVCMIGKSGCGKSTLLGKICDEVSGIVRTKSLAFVTQEDLLLDWRTALQNVLLPIELKGRVTKDAVIQAKKLLELVELQDSLHKLPSELSGGMRQRVTLARGLLQDSDLYLFDEPFSALDFDLRIQLGKVLREFIVSNRKAALFVTHNIEEAIALSDRVLVIGGRPGRIVHEEKITFTETKRNPVAIRAEPDFAESFATLWNSLSL